MLAADDAADDAADNVALPGARSWPPGAVPARAGRWVFGVATAWLAFLIYPVIEMAQQPTAPARLAGASAALCAFAGLYLRIMWQVAFTGRAWWPAVAALAALALALPPLYGASVWFGFVLYVAIVAGFALRPFRAGPAIAGLTGLAAVATALTASAWPVMLALPLLIGLSGLVALTVNWLLQMNRELTLARGEIARLAAGEERVRLARDLHDSVKQHVFVASMEVGASQALLPADSAAADHVDQAKAAIHAAQRDLAGLIDQLRPHALQGRHLGDALRDHVATWSRRHGIEAEFQSRGGGACLP